MHTILVTGAAGFIGYHLCQKLSQEGYRVIGLDNINAYYDVNLKYDRLQSLGIDRKDNVDKPLSIYAATQKKQWKKCYLCNRAMWREHGQM